MHGPNGERGCNRLALTDADGAGRDLVVSWMARSRPRRDDRRDRQRRRHPCRHGPVARAGDDRIAHRHGAHRRSLRRHPRRARRPRGARDADPARRGDAAAGRRRLLHRRGGLALRAGHARLARVRRRTGAGGGARRARRRRRRTCRRRARPHRLRRPDAVPGRRRAARVRRAAHRAGPGARARGHHDRRGHRRAGHLLDAARHRRPERPRRHDADGHAPRRRLRGRGDHRRGARGSPSASAPRRWPPSVAWS